MVEKTQGDTKEHVDDAENHRHFHLERIEEGQLIAGNIPDLWKTKESNATYKRARGGRTRLLRAEQHQPSGGFGL